MRARKTDGEPAVNCAFDLTVDPAALAINPKNPNRHPKEKLKLYAKILRHQGWRRAIVVSNQSKMVVTGAGATLCAREEGWSKVPVDFQDFNSPADEYAHMLADNRLPQMADIDAALMAEILQDEISGKLDEELAGALAAEPKPVELKLLEVKAPPKMAWVLVGIPLVRFSEINTDIERIAKLEGTTVISTVNDQVDLA